MNWAIAAGNTAVVARFLRQKAQKSTNEQMTNGRTNGRKMVVFLRDSILDKVELRKGNRKMNNKNMGVIKWADLFFGLREKREWRRKNVVSVV